MIGLITIILLLSLACVIEVTQHGNKIDELRSDIRDLENRIDEFNRKIALLHYINNSLITEIDFHLHSGSDELATSYFANCQEVRNARGESHSNLFDIWKGK